MGPSMLHLPPTATLPSLQRPSLLSSKPGSGWTSPLTSRSCPPLLSLGEGLWGLRLRGEEEVEGGRPLLQGRFFPLQYCQWLWGGALCLPEPEDCPGDAEAENHQPLPHEKVGWLRVVRVTVWWEGE